MTSPRIAIATCAKMPALTQSDAVIARALAARGAQAIAAPWNGPFAPFADADAVIIRSTWDYFPVPDEFDEWLARLEARANVFNAPALMRWNMGKLYLLELADRGVRIPPTARTAPDAHAIAAAMDALDLKTAIVKPVHGGTASGLSLVERGDASAIEAAAARLGGPGLVQAFLPGIVDPGETSFVFIEGAFSHAVVKRPRPGDIRVQSDHGGSVTPSSPPPWAAAQAARILALCPGETLYARIDAIVGERSLILMEAELVEPELFFLQAPEAADRLAAALLNSL